MDRVDPSLVVVSARAAAPLKGGTESVATGTPEATELAALPPEERLRLQAGFEAGLAELEDADQAPGVMVAPNHGPAALIQAFLAERAAETGQVVPTPTGAYEAKFDEKDWAGWAGSFFSWWRKLKKHDWKSPSPTPTPLKSMKRIAMLSDWGTGLYGAPVCAKSIEDAKAAPDVVLHLGDVYYAGTEKETEQRFLRYFPKVPNAVRRALNSNHEMYSGGYAYFRMTLPEMKQDASCFALENDRWLLVGLDTGYVEHDFGGDDQVAWLSGLLKRAKEKGQKVILTSHHQPYSSFETQGPKLVAALKSWLDAKDLFAWYWGHEHRLELYEKHPTWNLYGRCIGHSGFPYFRDDVSGLALNRKNADGTRWYEMPSRHGVPQALLLDGPNPYMGKEDVERFGPNGYVSIELGQDSIEETVHAADGTVLFQHELR